MSKDQKFLDSLELSDSQKAGKEGLSVEQEQKIADSEPDWDEDFDIDDSDKEIKSEDKDKEEESEEESEEEDEDIENEEKEEESDDEQKKQDKEKEDDQEKEDSEDERKEEERLKKIAEETGKTVEDVKAAEKEEAEAKRQEELEAMAKEENLPLEEVKAREEKLDALIEKHSKDPRKLAKALHSQQSAYDKTKSELEKLNSDIEYQQNKQDQIELDSYVEENKEALLEKYLETFPNEADKEEDVLIEKIKNSLQRVWNREKEKHNKEISNKAKNKRTEFLDGLTDEFKPYREDVKKMLDESSDAQILHKDFSVSDIAYWARGKKMTPEYIKSLETAAYRRGQENAKILGANNIFKKGKTRSQNKDDATSHGLNQDEMVRAEAVYAGSGLSKEQMYAEYAKEKANDF